MTDAFAGALALPWLPEAPDFRASLRALEGRSDAVWGELVVLAGTRMDHVRTIQVDRKRAQIFGAEPPKGIAGRPVRLALLGSSTLAHLAPAIRVAGLRRGLWIETYEAEYGQYFQEAHGSALAAFGPTAALFALDARHWLDAGVLERVASCWRAMRERFGAQVIQQTVLPAFPAVMGQNEHRASGSAAARVARLNAALRARSDEEGVDLLALDARAAQDGLRAWHDPALWHRAKQEVSPAAAPFYGDLVGRLLAAAQGRSAKCLVLDLDNTLWGGVIGDDGIDNIVLGQGSALGEAFLAVQQYARDLAGRGVLLAVCSKNDEANALEPFARHPEMILKREDIACFVANWSDKPANLRQIAERLNIGIDSLAFLDDNPFERALVRRELPMVMTPEISDDPGDYPRTLADAGYFEALTLTQEDRERTAQYRANAAREAMQAEATDLPTYLRSLRMTLLWRRFDEIGRKRVTQLINKTNQFNLTTRRYNEGEVAAVMSDADAVGLQLRLTDAFGDNGVIGIIIGRRRDRELWIETWLMSCRVLGREVERATLAVVVEAARRLGCERLVGVYVPSAKNGMVREHYARLGFAPTGEEGVFALDLAGYVRPDLPMTIEEG